MPIKEVKNKDKVEERPEDIIERQKNQIADLEIKLKARDEHIENLKERIDFLQQVESEREQLKNTIIKMVTSKYN